MKSINGLNTITLLLVVMLLAACGSGEEKISLDQAGTETKAVNSNDVVGTAKAQDSEPEEQDNEQAAPQTATVRELTSMTRYSGVGSFAADDDINISSKAGGTLVELRFDKGDSLRKGRLVAKVDPENYQLALESARAQLTVAEANLELARTEFERKKQLREDGAIPAATFDAVSTQLDLAVAQKAAAEIGVKQAEKALRDTDTVSPVSGVVSLRHVSVGEFVGPGDPLLTVSVLNPLKLQFSVPERLAARIAIGAEVEARVAAYPGKVFTGTVRLVGPTINQQTRTVPVEAEFDNDNEDLKPGFFAEIVVPLSGTEQRFSVPARALRETNGSYYVVTEVEGREIPVSIISRNEREAVVAGELNDGMQLAVVQ